jgi:hypothetical protein
MRHVIMQHGLTVDTLRGEYYSRSTTAISSAVRKTKTYSPHISSCEVTFVCVEFLQSY